MGAVQQYRVETVYEVVDKTTRELKNIEKATKEATQATNNLITSLKAVGLGFLGSSVFGKAKEMLISYNAALESSKVQIAGMITMYAGAPLEKSWDRAGKSVERFQEMAKKSSLTTTDLVNTASNLTRPLMQAGLTMGEVEKLTFGVANAAKAFGINGEVAARDIEQALTVGVQMEDRFARNLLGQAGIGLSKEQFNALSKQKKVETLTKALTSDAITEMAKKQGEGTFAGVASTLKDTIEIFGSKMGAPLFKAITDEIKSWNEWLEKNSFQIGQFVDKVASGLVSAFKLVKDAMGWIYDHADTLLAIGKVWAAVKIGQFMGGLQLGGGGAVGQAISGAFSGIGEKIEWGVRRGIMKASTFLGGNDSGGRLGQGIMAAGGAIGRFGGMVGNVAGGLGVGGVIGVGMAAHELSVAIGLDRVVRDAVNPMGAALRRVTENLEKMDVALDSARKSFEGQFGADVKGDFKTSEDLAVKRIAAMMTAMSFLSKDGSVIEKQAHERESRKLLQSVPGMSEAEVNQFMNTSPEARAALIAQARGAVGARREIHTRAVQETGLMMSGVTGLALTEEFKALRGDTEFWNKVNNVVLSKMLLAMESGVRLSVEDVTKIIQELKESEQDIKGQAKINQNIKVTINQMTAKDPHRWLLDLEDVAAKANRAGTRARGAWKSSPR